MQFITGVYLFLGLTLFGTFKTPALYMAALAFTAYGVHWFAMGWNRLRRSDPRVNVGMTIAFLPCQVGMSRSWRDLRPSYGGLAGEDHAPFRIRLPVVFWIGGPVPPNSSAMFTLMQ